MQANDGMSKVPAVTLGFWVIKIIATTLGETGGDAVSMTLNWGYALSSTMFVGIFAAAVAAQIAATRFHPLLYWVVIVATTTAGTTMADFADRSLGVGYPGGLLVLLACLMASLGVWYWQAGSISVHTVASPRIEMFTGPRSCFRKRWVPDCLRAAARRAASVAGLIRYPVRAGTRVILAPSALSRSSMRS